MKKKIIESLKQVYAGSELLIDRKIQAFYYALLSITGCFILYILLSLTFSFPDREAAYVLERFLFPLIFSFYLFYRGKYDVALPVSYLSIMISLDYITWVEEPLTEQSVYFITLAQTIGMIYLTLLAHRRKQILLGGIISLGTVLLFFVVRVIISLPEVARVYFSNFAGAMIILSFEISLCFLIHTLLYSSLREIQFQMEYNRVTGIPNRKSMLNALTGLGKLDKYLILVFYRIENMEELRLRLGDWTTVALIQEIRASIETEHQGPCFQVTGDTLAVVRKDPMTPVEIEMDRMIGHLKKPLTIGELTVQIYLRACITKTVNLPEYRQKLIDQGLRGLGKAALEHKKRIFFTDREEEQVQQNMDLIHELGTTIETGNCYPVYQAIHDREGRRIAFEALTRWVRNDGRPVSPDIFIPFLEQSGLMADFFFQMFAKILDDMKTYSTFFGKSRVFLNLSPELINDGFDFDRMVSLIEKGGFKKENFGFEVTESTMLKDTQEGVNLIEKLKGNGFVIALDDFGTGYSNITQILTLPLQKIKFDKSFIQGILVEPQKRDLCTSLMGHFHKYGYVTVAEGVEQKEQFDFLNTLGCHQYQGYLFARPIRPVQPPDKRLS